MEPIIVTLAGDKLALRFRYDAATVATLRDNFCGEGGTARWNPEDKCWTLPKGQWPALCATFGDRLSAAPDVWAWVYPAKTPRRRAARQRDIWGGSVAIKKAVNHA